MPKTKKDVLRCAYSLVGCIKCPKLDVCIIRRALKNCAQRNRDLTQEVTKA